MLSFVGLDQREFDTVTAAVPGGALNIQEIHQLTPLEQGIVFRSPTSDQGDASRKPLLISFDRRGRLDRFLDALREIIARHTILRTAILWEQLSAPVQVVLREAVLPVQEVTLEADGGASDVDVVGQLRERFDSHHFRLDIRQAPILRAFIAQDPANGRWLLVLLSHHLILTHVSLDVILDEVRLISAGRRDALPRPEPFRNFAAPAKVNISPEEHEAFFRNLLGDIDEPTAPYGLTHVQADGVGIREARLTLDSALTRRVRKLARMFDVDLAAIFHLAWALVLAHAAGQDDVIFGTRLLGRTFSGDGSRRTLERFVNALPMRVKIDAGSVESAVLHTHALLAELLRHEHAPLELVRRCSAIPAPAPPFSALFTFRHSPPAVPSDWTDAWTDIELLFAPKRTEYPLALAIDERSTDFLVTAQADSPIDPEEICRSIQTAVLGLLAASEDAPLTKVRTIGVLSREDIERVTTAANKTDVAYPSGAADRLFSQQAVRTPDEPAVISGTETLSYAQLDARSNQVAQLLVARGMREQSVVGVLLERSVATVVSLLAILKAGCIYLPLDSSYPPERLAHMLTDSDAQLVITNTPLGKALPVNTQQLLIDSPDVCARTVDVAPPTCAHSANDVAYIIYTSGSTGKPKGVAVPHAAAVNLAFARLQHDPIGVGDRILAAISVGFDVSIGQLLLPLLNGATVVIADDLRTLSAREFWEFLAAYGITHINSVPSFFDSILDAAPESSTLARLMLGGEPLTSALARRLRLALPDTQIFNMYGPTEACIDATCYAVSGTETSAVLPIGKPLPNYRAYILDASLEPVGIGIAGDLYLGGSGLARGYINDPALTAQRFIPDPFGVAGERLYYTGDRARRRADGQIEFLGRVDSQVKIRGHRIELGEIEAQLVHVQGVREVAVILREDIPDDRRLVAYYTAAEPVPGDVLRAAASAALPAYMIPAVYVQLASLPLTTNGKLNRKALPAPGADAHAARACEPPADGIASDLVETVAVVGGNANAEPPASTVRNALPQTSSGKVDAPALPQTADFTAAALTEAAPNRTERVLAALISEMLGRGSIGRYDNIFDLGFHSLLAIRLMQRIEQNFGLQLPLRALVDAPTVAGLALRVAAPAKSLHQADESKPIVTLNPHGTQPPFVYFHSEILAEGMYCRTMAAPIPDQPIYVVAPNGTAGLPMLPTLEAMARDLLPHIRSAQPRGPYRLGGYCAGGFLALEVSRLLRAQGESVERLIVINALAPYKRGTALTDRTIRAVARNASLEPRFRETLCANIARIGEALASGPQSVLRLLTERIRALSARIERRKHDAPGEINPFAMQRGSRATELYLAHVAAALEFRPEPYDGELILVWGDAQTLTSTEASMGWQTLVKNVRVVPMAGDHVSPLHDRAEELGGILAMLLA